MYIPHSDADRQAMLKTIGVGSMKELFDSLPGEKKFPTLAIPEGITEIEALREISEISAANETTQNLISFLGAGAYNHYSPAAVDFLLHRGEFYTAYTPYQPEISQGTLQAIFEYQSMITALTGMDVSNASHYDGATAVAEAISMAYSNFRGKKPKVVISPSLNPQYKETIETYTRGSDIIIVGTELSEDATPNELSDLIDDKTCLVVAQYPDFFGRVFNYQSLVDAAHDHGALAAIHVNPIALGLLKPPGEIGADIVTGEGQALGIPLSYGGPYLGIFATKQKYVRKMAGRLVGETEDKTGAKGYVLTLSTREQHIRREKATSNICTNQGLLALAAGIYMSLLGKEGIREVAQLNYHKAHYAADEIAKIPGFNLVYDEPFFNEFTVRCPLPSSEILEHLIEHDILGGFDLRSEFPGRENDILIAVTEINSKSEIDFLVHALSEVTND